MNMLWHVSVDTIIAMAIVPVFLGEVCTADLFSLFPFSDYKFLVYVFLDIVCLFLFIVKTLDYFVALSLAA
mgnify:CR=1 FL=1